MRHILFLFANRAHGQGAGKFYSPSAPRLLYAVLTVRHYQGGEVPTGVSPLYPGTLSQSVIVGYYAFGSSKLS